MVGFHDLLVAFDLLKNNEYEKFCYVFLLYLIMNRKKVRAINLHEEVGKIIVLALYTFVFALCVIVHASVSVAVKFQETREFVEVKFQETREFVAHKYYEAREFLQENQDWLRGIRVASSTVQPIISELPRFMPR
jgi:hypothetical protein